MAFIVKKKREPSLFGWVEGRAPLADNYSFGWICEPAEQKSALHLNAAAIVRWMEASCAQSTNSRSYMSVCVKRLKHLPQIHLLYSLTLPNREKALLPVLITITCLHPVHDKSHTSFSSSIAKTKRSGKVALVPSARCWRPWNNLKQLCTFCRALTQGWGKLVGSCTLWIAHCDVTKGVASSPRGVGDGPGQMLTPPFWVQSILSPPYFFNHF